MNNRADAEKFYTEVRKINFKEIVNQMYDRMVMARPRVTASVAIIIDKCIYVDLEKNDRMGKANGAERQTGSVASERSDHGASRRHSTGRVRSVD